MAPCGVIYALKLAMQSDGKWLRGGEASIREVLIVKPDKRGGREDKYEDTVEDTVKVVRSKRVRPGTRKLTGDNKRRVARPQNSARRQLIRRRVTLTRGAPLPTLPVA